MELKPCDECIQSLRHKLFDIKTKSCMVSYSEIKSFAHNNIHDIYTYRNLDAIHQSEAKYNIEHAIPASIYRGRTKDITKFYINTEPFTDPHILFPTFTEINELRKNYVYGELAENRTTALHQDHVTAITNQGYIYDNKIPDFRKKAEIGLKSLNESNDMYVSNLYGENCPIGNCIFQPSKNTTGEIYRIVFYFYLMYAYDPYKRPYTNNEPWLYNKYCNFFNMDAWNIFFNEHLEDYYKWSKLPISEFETRKNKSIIDKYILPNIFIGYYENITNKYIICNNMIDDLFFGNPHDHSKYLNISFYRISGHNRKWFIERKCEKPS